MNMRKRKNAGRLLSRLLCLVTVMGMLVPMALADELGKVPGSSDTNTYEKADIKVEISVVKHVQQTHLNFKWRTRLGVRSIPFPTTVLVWRN